MTKQQLKLRAMRQALIWLNTPAHTITNAAINAANAALNAFDSAFF